MTKLLSLVIWNNAKGSQTIDLVVACTRIKWALSTLRIAVEDPESAPGRALACYGFVSVVLTGPSGDQVVKSFADGCVANVSENGRGISEQLRCPEANAAAAREWLVAALAYAEWCVWTEVAKGGQDRPPVFDTLRYGHVAEDLKGWIGVEAEQYLHDWKSKAHERAAARARSAQPSAELAV